MSNSIDPNVRDRILILEAALKAVIQELPAEKREKVKEEALKICSTYSETPDAMVQNKCISLLFS